MGVVIGGLLPFSLGLAISPTAVITATLLAASPKTRSAAVGFLVGWVTGVLVAIIGFAFLSETIPDAGSDPSRPLVGVAKIVTGIVMVGLAGLRWRGDPRRGASRPPGPPRWMSLVESMTAVRGVALGVALSAGSPKNLMMAASAGLIIGAGDLTPTRAVIAAAVYVVLATVTVWVPVLGYLTGRPGLRGRLETAKDWLVSNAATVIAVLLITIGISQIGNGIALL